MEEMSILESEDDLYKLNSEFEERTRQWMKDIAVAIRVSDDTDSVISDVDVSHDKELDRLTQSLFIDDASSMNLGKKRQKRHKGMMKAKPASREPDSVTGLSSESTIRFLRAKVSLLQNQLITLQHQLTTATENLRKMETELKQSEDEKLKNSQELILNREKIRRHEQLINDLKEKNNLKQKEYNLLKRENEIMKRDTKKAMATATAYEVKLNRAKEEIDRLKLNLKLSQSGEKEARDEGRAKNEELTQSVRKLDKQKSELISAFKKQITLIENLKKQRTLTQASKLLKHADEEFLKILDWTSPNT